MVRQVALLVAAAPRSTIDGRFERHVSQNRRELSGSNSGGRWGPPGAYSVLYLGRPRPSVIVEAYRHLVDPWVGEGMTGDMVAPRRVLTCAVRVTEILDLRSAEAQEAVGLDYSVLTSSINEHGRCQAVARVAHQLGLHGIIAPAATRLGETLALFEQHLPADELPQLLSEEAWERLPADPRRLRIVKGTESA